MKCEAKMSGNITRNMALSFKINPTDHFYASINTGIQPNESCMVIHVMIQ